MVPDAPPAAVPFYRRGGFWLGVASLVPLLFGGAWALVDQHGRQYAADVTARMTAAGYRPAAVPTSPVPVPAEQNFCAHPMVRGIVEGNRTLVKRESKLVDALSRNIEDVFPDKYWHGPEAPCSSRTWGRLVEDPWRWRSKSRKPAAGERSPLTDRLQALRPDAPRSTLALADYLESKCGADMTALEQRVNLPRSTFEVAGAASPSDMPWTAEMYFKNLILVVAARGQLALENDDPSRALRSTLILLRLAGAMDERAATHWHSAMRANLARRRAAGLIWLAARDRRWSDAEWTLVAQWAGVADSRQMAMASLKVRLDSERDLQSEFTSPVSKAEMLTGGACACRGLNPLQRARGYLVPHGWFVGAMAHVELENWAEYEGVVATPAPAWPLHPVRLSIPEGTAVSEFFGYSRISRRWQYGTGPLVQLFAQHSFLQMLMRVTAALERWGLAHDAYPDSLTALVPDFLNAVPFDLDGAPLRYARESRNDRYKLWSVALNATDDGGRTPEVQTGRSDRDRWPSRDTRDWVWEYP